MTHSRHSNGTNGLFRGVVQSQVLLGRVQFVSVYRVAGGRRVGFWICAQTYRDLFRKKFGGFIEPRPLPITHGMMDIDILADFHVHGKASSTLRRLLRSSEAWASVKMSIRIVRSVPRITFARKRPRSMAFQFCRRAFVSEPACEPTMFPVAVRDQLERMKRCVDLDPMILLK